MEVFVFGANLAGIHGAGAAKTALQVHGAKWGQEYGLQGNSYAIPTKDRYMKPLSLNEISGYVAGFFVFAHAHPEMTFNVTRIGCGLAGYKDADISPMFMHNPNVIKNVVLPKAWGGEGFDW